MLYLAFLLRVFFSEAKKRNFIRKSGFFSLAYLFLSLVVINYKSYPSFIFSEYPLLAKLKIITLIFFGTFQSLAIQDTVLLLITAILFGLNIELVLRKIKFLAQVGGLHFTFGAGLITLVATGCASCGLSIASVVGLSAALAALPFHGLELYMLSIVILLTSLFYSLNTLVKVCRIER